MPTHALDFSLGLSFALGFLHAIEPGHGKTALFVHAASGNRSRLMPVVMGLSTAMSHTLSLLGVAILVHFTTHVLTGDHLHEQTVVKWMQGAGAGVIIAVGLWIIATSRRPHKKTCRCCSGHASHGDAAAATNADTENTAARDLRLTALLGTAVGLLPCPSALAAYFAGLSEGRPGDAYWMIAAFGLGIALSLIVVGFALQRASERLTDRARGFASAHTWAIVRGSVFIALGLFYAYRLTAVGDADIHAHAH